MAKTFANAAARAAYAIDPVYEARQPIYWTQLDTNMIYRPIRGGAGAENWEEVFYRGGAGTGLTFQHNFSIQAALEVTSGGDVGNAAAIGGRLASDTTPILRGDAAESQELSWATGNADIVLFTCNLPVNFDGASDVTVTLWVYSGSTDAATFTVETSWDGGAVVTDTADDTATKSATLHAITATIAAADIPNTAANLTMMLTPGTHGTDTTQLVGVRLTGFVTASQ